MTTRPQLVRAGYTAINLYIATTALLLFLETSRFRSHISDHGALLMVLSLFFLIPLSAVVLWFANRSCRGAHTRIQKAYLITSRVLLSIAWLISCAPVVFWIAVTQPWPLSIRHGPDTNYSKQGFATLMGFAPSSSVSRIYYRADEGWLDSGYRLRFTCSEPAVVSQIVSRMQLQESVEMKSGTAYKDSNWWAEKWQHTNLRCYAKETPGKYYWYLWYDPDSGIVWYEEFSV